MSELTPDEIRRRRLARLQGGGVGQRALSSHLTQTSAGGNEPQSAQTSARENPAPPESSKTSSTEEEIASSSPNGAYCMEVELCPDVAGESQQSDKGQSQLDVDSGIETMEVDDPEPKRKRNVSLGSEATEDQVKKALCRVFAVSWSEESSKAYKVLHLRELSVVAAVSFTKLSDLRDLINQMIMEAVVVIQDTSPSLDMPSITDQELLQSATSNIIGCWQGLTYHSFREFSTKFIITPSMQLNILKYLIDCYDRVSIEEKNTPKRTSIPPLSDALSIARRQCVCCSSLVLQGAFSQQPRSVSGYSDLVPFLLSHNLPSVAV